MHRVILTNGSRSFTTWSSHPQQDLVPANFDRVIFFLHGFPDNNDTWNNIVPEVKANYRGQTVLTLCPLLRGYEASSIGDDHDYKVHHLAEDIRAWILQIVPNKEIPVHLVGHDWGAIATFKAAEEYPELVTSCVTLAIPYIANLHLWHLVWYAPIQGYLSSYFITMQWAWLYGSKFGNLLKKGYLDELWSYWSPGWDFSEDIKSVRKTLAQPGVLQATTAYYRNLFRLKDISRRRWIVDFEKVPTLLLGGEKDGCMSHKVYELESRVLAPQAKVKVQLLSGVGHFLHREDPKKVAELICDWLQKYSE